jgi:hypothetical protein
LGLALVFGAPAAHGENGRWVQTVESLTALTQHGVHGVPFAPDSEQAYKADFRVADTLARAGLLQSAEFYALHRSIRQVAKERAMIRAQLARMPTFGPPTLAMLRMRHGELVAEAGVVVERALRAIQRDIGSYHDRMQELRIDLRTVIVGEIDRELEERKAALEASVAAKAPDPAVERDAPVAIAGSESMVWPFEGEFWRDEVGAYRSFLGNRCRRASAENGGTAKPSAGRAS